MRRGGQKLNDHIRMNKYRTKFVLVQYSSINVHKHINIRALDAGMTITLTVYPE
jgi:hypothetical protein